MINYDNKYCHVLLFHLRSINQKSIHGNDSKDQHILFFYNIFQTLEITFHLTRVIQVYF